MIEIFVGLMMLALITGPHVRTFLAAPGRAFYLRDSAVVRPIDGKLTLMFRAANARQNVVQEASAQLRMLRDEVTEEGFRIRRIVDLPLVRSQHPVFVARLDHHARHRRDQSAAGARPPDRSRRSRRYSC